MQLNTAKRASFDEGSLDQYLREISQYPLITREEEVTLAQRIKQSDAEALDKLVRSNLRFVVSVAKKYQNQGVSLSDLINEGNLGLIRAAHKFDETKGIKFISYAVWWIRQAILQALAEQSRIVRVPLNRAGTLHRIGKRSASLLQELGREPTVEEIAEGMDISEEEVAKTLSISQAHLSLDAPLTPGEDNKLLDYLPDTQNPGPDDEIFEHALTESIEEVLKTLKEREAKILRLYFGLDGQEPMTLEEIGSPYLNAHLRSGYVYVLSDWRVAAQANAIEGRGTLLDARRVLVDSGWFRLPVDSVALFETNVLRRSGATTALTVMAGVTAAVAGICAASPKTCFGSCPTFYAPDSAGADRLQAEGVSASIAPALEATHVDMLYHVRPRGRDLI